MERPDAYRSRSSAGVGYITKTQRTFIHFCPSLVVLLWVSVGVLAATVSGSATESASLRIMSWNVRNYNLTDRSVDGIYRRDYPKPEIEKTALRQVISLAKPDLILFQEIGGDAYLKELSEDLLAASGLDYSYFKALEVDDEDRKLGVLSKIPFEMILNPVNEGGGFHYLGDWVRVKRGLLEIQLDLGQWGLVQCLSYHLKSRFTVDTEDQGSCERREKEARTIREYLREKLAAHPNLPIVMMGDMNDCFGSQAYDRITLVGGNPIMKEIPVKDDRGECWTYYYARERRYEQIDFLFVSPCLLNNHQWNLEARIVSGPDVSIASDHRPLLVDLEWIAQ